MKILWVNPSFLDYRIPVYRRLNELTGGNFHIVFSQNRVPERIPVKIHEAIGDNAICFEGEKRIILGKFEGMANKWASIPITHGLYKAIKSVGADIVIAEGFFQWTPQAVRYATLHHVPLLIAYERTAWTERECPRWRSMYRQVIDRFTDGYLCNGELTRQYLATLGVKEQKLFTGGMSADSEGLVRSLRAMPKAERLAFRKQINGGRNGLTYLYSGQLIPRKGLSYLLDAWKKHVENHTADSLVLVGDGELREQLTAGYAAVPGVNFCVGVPYDDIYRYYGAADVFVIPTLEDNWSLVVPEAMACGLPVATSIYNGCHPELVRKGENGITFDTLRESTILEALDYFHHVDLAAFGRRSVELESQYDYIHAADNIYSACQSVLSRQK